MLDKVIPMCFARRQNKLFKPVHITCIKSDWTAHIGLCVTRVGSQAFPLTVALSICWRIVITVT